MSKRERLIKRDLVKRYFELVQRSTFNEARKYFKDYSELITALAHLSSLKVIKKQADGSFLYIG